MFSLSEAHTDKQYTIRAEEHAPSTETFSDITQPYIEQYIRRVTIEREAFLRALAENITSDLLETLKISEEEDLPDKDF